MFFGAEDGSADYGGVLVVGEVLLDIFLLKWLFRSLLGGIATHCASISGLEEAGSSIEDFMELSALEISIWDCEFCVPMGTSAMMEV